jgi:hypothetical protein
VTVRHPPKIEGMKKHASTAPKSAAKAKNQTAGYIAVIKQTSRRAGRIAPLDPPITTGKTAQAPAPAKTKPPKFPPAPASKPATAGKQIDLAVNTRKPPKRQA